MGLIRRLRASGQRLLPGNLRSPVNIFRGPQVADRRSDKGWPVLALQNKSSGGGDLSRNYEERSSTTLARIHLDGDKSRFWCFVEAVSRYRAFHRVGLFVASDLTCRADASCLSIDASISARDKHTFVVWRDFFSFSFFFWIWNVYLLIIFRKKGENRFFFEQLWLGLRIFSDDDVRLRMLLMIILAGVIVMQLWNIDYTFKIYIMFFVWVWERYW